MGSIVAQRIIDQASIALQDEKKVRWKLPELLYWLNEAQVQIVNAVPSAYTKSGVHKMAEGVLQQAPDGTVAVLYLSHNMGADGTTPGKRIRTTTRECMDQSRAKWPGDRWQLDVVHFMPDPFVREQFWIWPGNTGSGHVLMTYSAIPPEVTAGQPIAISDVFRSAIMNWICWRAHSKDTEAAADSKASAFYQSYLADVGLHQAKTGA